MAKRDDRLQGGGRLNQPLVFFNVVETKDENGRVVRTPQQAYTAMGGWSPFQGSEQRDGLREVGETWAMIQIRYHHSRVPIEGMQVLVKLTQETYEVRGVIHIAGSRKVIELTCRLVR